MRKLGQPKILLAVLCSAIAFNAHASFWDNFLGKNVGDDGNVNTKGNAAAAANKGKTSQAANKAYVGLVNDTKSILTSAVLKDKTGKVLYTSTAGRTCAAGAVCWLRVLPGLMTKGNTFFFYNNSKLVSALVLDNLPANASLYNIGANMDSLGLYVMNKIRAVNPKVTYTRIDNDIQTTTLSATPYQELADYYLDLMGNSKDNTAQEAKVIKSMADQFAKNKTIPANPSTNRLSNKNMVMAKKRTLAKANGPMVGATAPASAEANPVKDALCSQTLDSAMDGLSLIPMIGDVVATAAKTAKSASCPSDDQDVKDFMAEQFAVVNTKLGEISTQLVGLENQLKEFEQTYNTDKLTEQKTDVDKYDIKLTTWLGNYQRALLTSRGKDGKEYNSLNEMVSSFGSLDKAFAKNPELRGILNGQLYTDDAPYDAIVNLGTISTYFSTAKKNQICSNPDKIAGNVLEIRAACNAIMVAMYSKNVILAKQMAYAYNDVYKVYKIDNRPDKKVIQVIESGNFAALEKNIEQMNPKIAITKPVGDSEPVFNLVSNLRAKGFNVTGWYTDADKRYLEVNYTLGGTIIKSKYAYEHPTRDGKKISYASNAEIDNNIANVLGVPVPERFFTADGKSRNNYGAIEAFPWTNQSSIGRVISVPVATNFAVPANGNVAINAFGFSPENNYNKSQMVSPNLGFIEGVRNIFVPSPTAANTYLVQYPSDDFDRIGAGGFFTFMRYTAADGYTYIWTMRTWLKEGGALSDSFKNEWLGAPQCMTNDCLAIDTGAKLESLKFQNGPTVTWTFDDFHTFTLNVK